MENMYSYNLFKNKIRIYVIKTVVGITQGVLYSVLNISRYKEDASSDGKDVILDILEQWSPTLGLQMFSDFNSQKSWPAEMVVKASGSCSQRTSGGSWLGTTALENCYQPREALPEEMDKRSDLV